jgi:glycopeptide antibiotics resistance protein
MKLALFLLWTLVIVGVTTLPWSNYTGHSHWDHVRWVPFSERHPVTTDVVLNVMLFVPFGFLLMWAGSGARSAERATSVVVLAAIVSILAEYFQVYCHNRIPSATDVCTNVLGAGLGILLKWWS